MRLKAAPAIFNHLPASPERWCFVLVDKSGGYEWAFPGWKHDKKTPHHYFIYCKKGRNGHECPHKPPKVFMQLWKTLLNLKMGL